MARPHFAKLAQHPKTEAQETVPSQQSDQNETTSPVNAPKIQRSRQGKKSLTVFLASEQVKAVRLMAVRNERTLEDMTREALDDLLRKYGEHPAG